MSKKRNRPASLAEAHGSAKYRLLGYKDAICVGDEFLRDNCQTWELVSKENCPFVGMGYNGYALVPMRRRLPNDEVSDAFH